MPGSALRDTATRFEFHDRRGGRLEELAAEPPGPVRERRSEERRVGKECRL